MEKRKIYKLFINYLDNNPEDFNKKLLNENLHIRKEIEEMGNLIKSINQIHVPEPSDSMKKSFNTHLDALKNAIYEKDITLNNNNSIVRIFTKNGFLKLAAAILIFITGFLTGIFISNQSRNTTELLSELQNSQKDLILTLLQQPTASDRLKAVNISYQIENHDQRIIDALLATLNNDPNINVRLSTIDVLMTMADNPKVRSGLIQSINNQESPLIQNALVDAMVFLNEKLSLEQLQILLDRNKLNHNVKKKVTESIRSLTGI
jgi:hypothetical protein